MSAMVHVQRGQYLCQVFGNPVLETGIMGKGYNWNIIVRPENKQYQEENQKAYTSNEE